MSRIVDAVMTLPSHHYPRGTKCVSMTATYVSSMQVQESWYASLTLSRGESAIGATVIMDRTEVENLIGLLRNAIDDADLLNAGQPPIHNVGAVRKI
jgi:hypothetical protein